MVHGVVCIMTGNNDAFAVSVETGAALWECRANFEPKVALEWTFSTVPGPGEPGCSY